MNSVNHETLFKYIVSSKETLKNTMSEIISHMFGRASGDKLADEQDSLLSLVKNCFSLTDNNNKVSILQHTCNVYSNIRDDSELSRLKKKLLQELYCELIEQENYDITIKHIQGGYYTNNSLLNCAIDTECKLIIDATFACRIATNSGSLASNSDNSSPKEYTSTLFSSAINKCLTISNLDTVHQILSLPWDKTIDVNSKAVASLYSRLEGALIAHSYGHLYNDYAENSTMVKNTIEDAFKFYKDIENNIDSRYGYSPEDEIDALKKSIATLAGIEGDINAAFSKEAINQSLVEIAKQESRGYSYSSSTFTHARFGKTIGRVVNLFEPIIKTKNIFTDQDSALPAYMYKLSKVEYGNKLIEYIKTEFKFEQLIADATSSAQAELLLNLSEIDPFTALSLIKKESIKTKLMATIMS